jgi:hypothetical protein
MGTKKSTRVSGREGTVMSGRSKAKRRPKARKERVDEVAGHKLTKEQQAEFERELKQLWRQFPNWTAEAREERALSDCLYRWRPSVKARQQFKTMDLYQRTVNAAHAIGSLREFPMDVCGERVVEIGNELIKHIADELDAVSRELRTIHEAIAKEEHT